MSVQDKLTGFQTHRDEVQHKRQEFGRYADEFDAGSARKADPTHLQAAIDELHQEFTATRGIFDEYNERFADHVDQKEDISELLAAVERLEAEFESTDGRFGAYARLFDDDVEELGDVTELREATADLRGAFVDVVDVFDGYGDAFEADVGRFRDAVEGNRRAFGATQRDFEAYAEAIRPDVESLRNPTDLIESIERMRASIASRETAFRTYATGSFGNQLSAFDAGVDEVRDGYDETQRRFTAYADDFHQTGQPAGTTEANEPEVSPSQAEVDSGSTDDAKQQTATDSTDDAESGADFAEEAFGGSDAAGETAMAKDSSTTGDGSSTGAADVDSQPADMIPCEVCGEYYKAITEPHLQTHGMTIDNYREEFGEDTPLRPGGQ